jgi:hypothetical protein
MILWIFAGCILVGIPYFFLMNPTDLWPSVYGGGIGGAIFLITLYIYGMKHDFQPKQRMSVGIALAILLLSTLILWPTFEAQSKYQRSSLGQIRTSIAEGTIKSEALGAPAYSTYVAYQKQSPSQRKSIVSVFKNLHGSKIKHDIMSLREYEALMTYVQFLSDTAVMLVSVDTVARGTNAFFGNKSGHLGRVQCTAVVSKMGVTYERNN